VVLDCVITPLLDAAIGVNTHNRDDVPETAPNEGGDRSMSVRPDGPSPELHQPTRQRHLCPWWIGYLLVNPLRRLTENPEKILSPLVQPGMTAVDVGCAMGFFSLPLARMVGEHGRVVCVDVQERMLSTLVRRARRRGLDHVIEPGLCTQESLGLDSLKHRAGLVLAAHVVHESTHPGRFLSACRSMLRPGGHLLILEPRGHVSDDEFAATRKLVLDEGLIEQTPPKLRRSHTLVVQRQGD
jgi:2-polyprenyl-3-methyl-5-hydroxy-6-metoxy-1,4-benzoquinol methylase